MSDASTASLQGPRALVWLMRAGGLLLASASVGAIGILLWGATLHFMQSHDTFQLVLGFLVVPVIVSFYAVILKLGYDMFRKLNLTTVTHFSFVFALLVANAWYHVLPEVLPANIADFCRHNAFLVYLTGQGQHQPYTYRGVLAFLAFIVFYNCLKAYFLRRLGLIKTEIKSPCAQDAHSSDQEEPFVPFNPYDLSQNPVTNRRS